MSTQNGIRIFYRDDKDLERIHDRLKLTRCPHCGRVGTLIFNGKSYGYHDDSSLLQLRRQRVICNHRKACSPGCGGGQSLFSADSVPGLQVLTKTLWLFASLLLAGLAAYPAFRSLGISMDIRAAHRWREKFRLAQAWWRVLLCGHRPPPESPELSDPLVSSLSLFPSDHSTYADPFFDYQYGFQRGLL